MDTSCTSIVRLQLTAGDLFRDLGIYTFSANEHLTLDGLAAICEYGAYTVRCLLVANDVVRPVNIRFAALCLDVSMR